MTLLYADTSAIVRAYFADEPDHLELRYLLLEEDVPVVTSEITRVEVASAVRSAAAHGRLPEWVEVLARFDADCSDDGALTLLALRPAVVLATARRLVLDHRLSTLDALHVATAIEECPPLADGGEVTFVTRDGAQGEAARALGFTTR